MQDNLLQNETPFIEKPKRSQLLTTLCVLSFIMCAFGVLSGIWNIYQSTPEAMQRTIEQIKAVDPAMADQMENNMLEMQANSFYAVMPYLGIVYTLISFLGVMMMWNFKKNGFYIYAIAEILPYSSFLLMGKNSLKMIGPPGANSTTFAMFGILLMIIIDLVFVFLYSRTAKDMK